MDKKIKSKHYSKQWKTETTQMLIKNKLFKSIMVNAFHSTKHYMTSKRVTCPWMKWWIKNVFYMKTMRQ